MLIGFGGPAAAAEVRPFLDRVLAGRPVPRERYEAVVGHYEALGGRSPYNESTMRQAAALQARLREVGIRAPVVVGFRNTPPFFDDALSQLRARGIRRALGFVLAAHRSEASWDRYLTEIRAARQRLGQNAPEVEYPPLWHDHPAFIDAVSDRARAALVRLDAGQRDIHRSATHIAAMEVRDSAAKPIDQAAAESLPRTRGRLGGGNLSQPSIFEAESPELIFTAHSIPLSMPGRAAYVEQLNQSARAIARNLGHTSWTLAFQSRSGSPREPWLEPDINDALRALAGSSAVVIPVGFLCDHVEVLYDLDIDAAKAARETGVRMERAATVCDHPKFIRMLADIAQVYLSRVRHP
jgi:ferrochelatase